MFLANTMSAWSSIIGASPTPGDLRLVHGRVLLGAVVLAVTSMWAGTGRARRGGTLTDYVFLAVTAILIAVAGPPATS